MNNEKKINCVLNSFLIIGLIKYSVGFTTENICEIPGVVKR